MDINKAILSYQKGDEASFNYLYNKTYKLVRIAIYSYISAKETVEDLIQDVYLKVSNTLKEFTPTNFNAYIYTIAKNKALDYLKKKSTIHTDEIYLKTEISNPYLNYAINHLEALEKEVFLMKVLCGHTSKKIASILDINSSKVNQLFYQAKNKLKKSLEEENELF